MKMAMQTGPVKAKKAAVKKAAPALAPRLVSRVPSGGHRPSVALNPGFEGQADRAAERIQHGEQGAVRLLGRIPAAHEQVPASRGLPLPAELRTELESGFGATLDAVRLHTDVAAAQAATARHAQAFTSGRDIYFAAGAFEPSSESGRHLLLHETAHVLQQTGRASQDGVRATSVSGPGMAQNKGEGKDYRQRRSLTFDSLVGLHTQSPADEELKRVIENAGSVLNKNLDNETGAETLEKQVMAAAPEFKTKSARARSFLFDVLKVTDRWDGACWLLDQDLLLQTAAPVNILAEDGKPQGTFALVEYYRQHKNGSAWFNTVAATHFLLREYWPTAYLDTLWTYMIGPTRAIQSLSVYRTKPFRPDLGIDTLGDFSTAKEAYALAWLKAPGLRDNELVIQSFKILDGLDHLRQVEVLPKITAEVDAFITKNTDSRMVTRRVFIAEKIRNWGRGLQKDTVAPEILGPLGEKIAALAIKALDFWAKVAKTTEVTFDREHLESVKKARPEEVIRLAPAHATLVSALPKTWLKANAILFKLANDKEKSLPDSKQYSLQIKAAGALLMEFAKDHLEIPMVEMSRRDKVDEDQVLVYAWFMAKVYTYIQFLELYDTAKDQVFVDTWHNPDIRLAHRLQAAGMLDNYLVNLLAGQGLTDWDALHAQLQAVLTNVEQNHSALALLGEWKKQPEKKISLIASEFKVIRVAIEDPLTHTVIATPDVPADLLTNLYLLLYYGDVAGKISDLLSAAAERKKKGEAPEVALQSKSILEQAFSDADEFSRPQRFGLSPLEYAPSSVETQKLKDAEGNDVDVPRAQVFSFLVANHPKTVQAQGLESGRNRMILSPDEGDGEAFFWSVPPVMSLISALQADGTGLNEMIAAALKITVQEVKSWNSPWLWFQNLIQLPKDVIAGAVTKAHDERLVPQIRNAVNYERRLIAALTTKMLPEYTGTVLQGKPGSYDLPLELLALMDRFARWVEPEEDRFAQMAALMLSVAPALKVAFANQWHPEDRNDIINGFLGHIILGIGYTSGERLRELRRVADASEIDGLLANVGDLKQVHDVLVAARQKHQLRFGFESTDTRTLSTQLYKEFPIEPATAFRLDGDWYNLLEVVRKFEYHPPFGIKPLDENQLDISYSPPLLLVNGEKKVVGPQGSDDTLFVLTINGRKTEVSARDEALLTHLAYVVEMRGNLLGLENLNELIEASMDAAMDAAEFIPGAGQALAAARIVTAIMQFIASGEFQRILEAFTNDPWEMIKKAGAELSERISPEGMWDFLLFENPLFEWLMKVPEKNNKGPVAGGKGSRLAKVIAKLQGIRIGIGKALKWLHTKVQMPMHAFEAVVQSHPLLSAVIGWISDHIYEIVLVIKNAPELLQNLKNWFNDGKEMFYARLQGLMDGLAGLELPNNVLPIKEAAGALFDMILGRFKTKGKIIRGILNATGAMDEITGAIESMIIDSPYNPNQIWVDAIKPPIEEKFVEVRDALSDKVYEILHDQLGLDVKKPDPARKEDVSPQMQGDDGFDVKEDEMTEMQGYGVADPDPAAVAALPAPSGGQPLAPPVRAAAESRLGHDFGHVRLHHGAEASQAINAYGAQGLASGSHVYLRPGLNPADGQGQQILSHELTHVVQQTGPRPLGGSYSAIPHPGKPGSGLKVNAAQEAAAEQAMSGGQVQAGSGGEEPGVQPAGLSLVIMRKLLNDLSDIDSAQKHRAGIENIIAAEKRKGKNKADVPANELQMAESLYAQVRDRVLKWNSSDLPKVPVLSDAKAANPLKAYLSGQFQRYIGPAVSFIAEAALVDKPKAKDAKADQKRDQELNLKDFGYFLQQYIMAMTGVTMIITTQAMTATRSMPQGGWLNKVEITNLLIGLVPAQESGGEIWDAAMSAFGTNDNVVRRRQLIRGALRQAGASRWVVTSDQGGSSDRIPIWDGSKFAFSAEFVAFIKKMELATTTVTKADLPSFPNYVNYSRRDGGPVIGIRIGKYGDPNQEGQDRESHHTTQWLLIEYFRNRITGKAAFEKKYRPVWESLGVAWDADGPAQFKHPGKDVVDFRTLDKGSRGDEMPSILLAASTHQGGKLHIRGAQAEDWGGRKNAKRPTQAGTVHNVFQMELLSDELAPVAKGGSLAEFKAAVQGKEPAVQDRIYSALQTSYRDMYNQMDPALKRALPDLELGYYESVAELGEPDKDAGPEHGGTHAEREKKMNEVYQAAKKNNNTVMRQYGWKEA